MFNLLTCLDFFETGYDTSYGSDVRVLTVNTDFLSPAVINDFYITSNIYSSCEISSGHTPIASFVARAYNGGGHDYITKA